MSIIKNLNELHSFNDCNNQKIIKICQPLFKNLKFNYFGQTRVFHDGPATALITLPELMPYWVYNNYHIPAALCTGFYIASQLGEIFPIEKTSNLKKIFGLDHVLFFIDRNENYTDAFMIAAKPDDRMALNNYINNAEWIKKFIQYFKYESYDILNDAKQHKVLLPVLLPEEKLILMQSDTNGNLPDERIISFIHSHKEELIKAKISELSKQEFLCLKFSSQGKTAKECAKLMNISHRTVEKYFENIKYKLGYEKKRDLIDIFLKTFTWMK